MKKVLTAVVISLTLAGCLSTGNESLKKETEVSIRPKIIEGITTKSEIKAMFSSPLRTLFTENGKEIWTYELADSSADAVNYIPVVNLFGSSASGIKKELVVMFDGDKVQRYSMSESPVSIKTGLFNLR